MSRQLWPIWRFHPLAPLEELNNAANHSTKSSRFISLNSTQITPEPSLTYYRWTNPLGMGKWGKSRKPTVRTTVLITVLSLHFWSQVRHSIFSPKLERWIFRTGFPWMFSEYVLSKSDRRLLSIIILYFSILLHNVSLHTLASIFNINLPLLLEVK